jgi:hypothetical protein
MLTSHLIGHSPSQFQMILEYASGTDSFLL